MGCRAIEQGLRVKGQAGPCDVAAEDGQLRSGGRAVLREDDFGRGQGASARLRAGYLGPRCAVFGAAHVVGVFADPRPVFGPTPNTGQFSEVLAI